MVFWPKNALILKFLLSILFCLSRLGDDTEILDIDSEDVIVYVGYRWAFEYSRLILCILFSLRFRFYIWWVVGLAFS